MHEASAERSGHKYPLAIKIGLPENPSSLAMELHGCEKYRASWRIFN